jgi:hypothetical protein
MKLKHKSIILDLSDNGGIHKNNSFKDYFMKMQAEAKQNTKIGLNTNMDGGRIHIEPDKNLPTPINLDDDYNNNSKNNLINKSIKKEDSEILIDSKPKLIIKNFDEYQQKFK